MDGQIKPDLPPQFPALEIPMATDLANGEVGKKPPKKLRRLAAILILLLMMVAGTDYFIIKSGLTRNVRNLILDKQVRSRISQLEKLSNEKEYGEIYEEFFSPSQKGVFVSYTPIYKDIYIQSLDDYYRDHNVFIEFDVGNISIIDNKAYVTRSLKTCYDKSCSQLFADERSEVEWYLEDGAWYTTQEQPLCVRESPYNTSTGKEGVTKKVDPVSGVEIIWKIECGMFPIYFSEPPISTEVVEIAPTEVSRMVTSVERAMDKLPKSTVKKYLDKIYLLGSLRNFGVGYGGTNVWKNIYLANEGLDMGYTDEYIEQMFHHEFSSILLAENDPYYNRSETKWDNPTWNLFNDPDFSYGTGGYNEIKEKSADQEFDQFFIDKGFLNQYSTSSAENDFNEIAMNIFTGSDEFWKIVDTNKIIGDKVKFFIDFYYKIDPVFTEEYFRSMGKY
ncbi:MAG: hypothetical protein WC686_02755 [Candidatus Shapirobacteria bacterium]|jgi:hypothetical protein